MTMKAAHGSLSARLGITASGGMIDLDQCWIVPRLLSKRATSTPCRGYASREVAMSDFLEHSLDITLDMRERHRRQHENEVAVKDRAVRSGYVELERRQTQFCTEVRSLIRDAAEQANRHLARRPEKCEFREVLRYRKGPWFPGGPICDPITYQLVSDDREVGEVLIVELMHDGMVAAMLGPLDPSQHPAHSARTGLEWHSVPLFSFDRTKAVELLVQYLAAITERWPL